MNKSIDLTHSSINLLLEINGEIHLVAMKNSKLETIQALVQMSVEGAIPTGKTQGQLNDFLGYEKRM